MIFEFSLEDVKPLYEHCMKEEIFCKPYVGEETKDKFLEIVKDHGVYLLAGSKNQMPSVDGKTKHYCAYAKGYNPYIDEDWFFSGDDYVEMIPLSWVDMAMEAGVPLKISVTKKQLSLIMPNSNGGGHG